MLSLKNEPFKRSSNQLDSSLKNLNEKIIEKNAFSHEKAKNERGDQYPEFARPDLVPKLGQELTQDLRKNFDLLIEEAKSLSASKSIPDEQIEDLRNFVFTHRIFSGSSKDHDRARVEFEINKNSIISEWEKKYSSDWPKYQTDVYTDGKLSIKAGKMVSRHHFLPVRSVAIKETPENNKLLEKGLINPKNELLYEHYPVNAYWNMIPSKAPGDHTDKIHGDNSIFSKVFGPIKLDYHYKEVNPTHFESIVPETLKEKSIPLFVKEYDFYLNKLEEKTGFNIPDKQRILAVEFLTQYVNEFPNNQDLTNMSYKNQGRYIYEKLVRPFNPIYNKKTKMLEKSFLMKQWEKERGEKWPLDKSGHLAQPTFLIQPYSKINSPKWWLYQPDLNSVPK